MTHEATMTMVRQAPEAAKVRRLPQATATAPSPSGGMLLGRPDLSDDAVIEAIKDRLAFEGRDRSEAEGVLAMARAGDSRARKLLRGLVLPARQARLTMPTQIILHEKTSFNPLVRFALKRR